MRKFVLRAGLTGAVVLSFLLTAGCGGPVDEPTIEDGPAVVEPGDETHDHDHEQEHNHDHEQEEDAAGAATVTTYIELFDVEYSAQSIERLALLEMLSFRDENDQINPNEAQVIHSDAWMICDDYLEDELVLTAFKDAVNLEGFATEKVGDFVIYSTNDLLCQQISAALDYIYERWPELTINEAANITDMLVQAYQGGAESMEMYDEAPIFESALVEAENFVAPDEETMAGLKAKAEDTATVDNETGINTVDGAHWFILSRDEAKESGKSLLYSIMRYAKLNQETNTRALYWFVTEHHIGVCSAADFCGELAGIVLNMEESYSTEQIVHAICQ